MLTLDLLRNHSWNLQAIITDHEKSFDALNRFEVRVETMTGSCLSLTKRTFHTTRNGAYRQAHMVVFGNLDGFVSDGEGR